jgi:hypothetical protein
MRPEWREESNGSPLGRMTGRGQHRHRKFVSVKVVTFMHTAIPLGHECDRLVREYLVKMEKREKKKKKSYSCQSSFSNRIVGRCATHTQHGQRDERYYYLSSLGDTDPLGSPVVRRGFEKSRVCGAHADVDAQVPRVHEDDDQHVREEAL